MTEKIVMDQTKSENMAKIKLVHYVSAIKALEASEFMGAEIEPHDECWQIVLIDSRKK